MSEPSYYAKGSGGFFVRETIEGAHAIHTTYPLLPGDWIMKRDDGRWGKIGPGLGIEGFRLTPAQELALEPNTRELTVAVGGMEWFVSQLGSES